MSDASQSTIRLPAGIRFSVYIIVFGAFFVYSEFSLTRLISGALFGASIGVGEFNILTEPLITKIVAMSGAVLMLLSMSIMGFNSIESSNTFYLCGLIFGVLIYWAHFQSGK